MQAIDWEVIFATLISPEQVRGVVANDPALDPLIRQYFRPLRRDVSNALVILCQGYLAAWLATLVGRSLSREDRFASLAEMVKKSVVFANLDFSMVHEPQKRYEEAKRPDWWNVFQRRGLADFERLKRELRVEQGQPAERSAIFVGWPECHNRRDADRWPLCAAEEILDRIEGGQVIDDTALVWHTLLELLPASKGESPRTPTIG